MAVFSEASLVTLFSLNVFENTTLCDIPRFEKFFYCSMLEYRYEIAITV